jgi:hypothetical protein
VLNDPFRPEELNRKTKSNLDAASKLFSKPRKRSRIQKSSDNSNDFLVQNSIQTEDNIIGK